jgi:hypothetical protein
MRPALTIRASFADMRRENQSQHPKAKMIRACSSSTRKRVEAMGITEVITTRDHSGRTPMSNALQVRFAASAWTTWSSSTTAIYVASCRFTLITTEPERISRSTRIARNTGRFSSARSQVGGLHHRYARLAA